MTHHVSVLVAGTFLRYFTSACVRLIAPMTQQGHSVDYYTVLTTGQTRRWRPTTLDVTYDPHFGLTDAGASRPSNERIEATVRRCVEAANGTLRHLELPEAVNFDDDPRLQRALNARSTGGVGDPWTRFPLPSFAARARTAVALDAAGQANRNFVRVYKALEHLWNAMEATEVETGRRYTHTLVVRDDADWLAPMDLSQLLASRPDAHGFALSCDARVPPLHLSEINDHAMLLTRERADFIGRFYSTVILGGGAAACRVHISRSGVHSPCTYGQPCVDGCNSEELMRWALTRAGLRVHLVGQALLPFQRSSHILVPPHGRSTIRCFHKLCQSHEQPLSMPPGRGLCSKLNRQSSGAPAAAKKPQLRQAELTRKIVRRLVETLPADELLSATTISEARVASQNCSRVAYTSVDVAGPHPLIVPPRRMDASCTFVFVSPSVTRLPLGYTSARLRRAKRKFMYVSNIRSPATRGVSPRLFSKLPKLSPHLLFPGKWTVFFDSKLHMRASMDELWAVYQSRVMKPRRPRRVPFTAILHPYMWMPDVLRHATSASAGSLGGKFLSAAWANRSVFQFMQTEASLLLTPQPQPFCPSKRWTRHTPCAFKPLRVANASILRHQIGRYVALSTTAAGPPADSYRYYIDTALLMQQDAGELFGPWRAEMARTDSSDRDQISFAHTAARLQLRLRLLSGCHRPVRAVARSKQLCGPQLCHWYINNASSVAKVMRTALDKPAHLASEARLKEEEAEVERDNALAVAYEAGRLAGRRGE
jgi:hypothetical protein